MIAHRLDVLRMSIMHPYEKRLNSFLEIKVTLVSLVADFVELFEEVCPNVVRGPESFILSTNAKFSKPSLRALKVESIQVVLLGTDCMHSDASSYVKSFVYGGNVLNCFPAQTSALACVVRRSSKIENIAIHLS